MNVEDGWLLLFLERVEQIHLENKDILLLSCPDDKPLILPERATSTTALPINFTLEDNDFFKDVRVYYLQYKTK